MNSLTTPTLANELKTPYIEIGNQSVLIHTAFFSHDRLSAKKALDTGYVTSHNAVLNINDNKNTHLIISQYGSGFNFLKNLKNNEVVRVVDQKGFVASYTLKPLMQLGSNMKIEDHKPLYNTIMSEKNETITIEVLSKTGEPSHMWIGYIND